MTVEILVHSRHDLDFMPHDCRWVPNSTRFIVLGMTSKSTGKLNILEVREDGTSVVSDVDCPAGLKCCTFGAHTLPERLIATGNFEGELEIRDLENATIPQKTILAHNSTINAIDGVGGGENGVGAPEIVTGGRDGLVKVWDTRQDNNPVAILGSNSLPTCECWSVAFGNSFDNNERCVLAGYENGDVKLYDLRASDVAYEINVDNGVCSVEFDRKDILMNKFVVSCLESQYVVFNGRRQHVDEGFASLTCTTETKTTLWGVRHLPQNRDMYAILLGDGTIELYNYEYPSHQFTNDPKHQCRQIIGHVKRIGSHALASQPINSFDWHRERRGLAVCTGLDQSVHAVFTVF